MYAKLFKRVIDFTLSLLALIALSPVMLTLAVVGAIVMRGNPFFTQIRPGKKGEDGKEKLFKLIKFRTMHNTLNEEGEFLSDGERLTAYGKLLRATSLDELPELFNILKGEMSIVGPRPQLVRDMTFMTARQRRRHDVLPGLTGLAQINGRNNITWEEKFNYDLQYIDNGITLLGDLKILIKTVLVVLKRSDTVRDGTHSDLDFGDWLFQKGEVTEEVYHECQQEAKDLLGV